MLLSFFSTVICAAVMFISFGTSVSAESTGFIFEQAAWTDFDMIKQEYDDMTENEGISEITEENIKSPENSALIHNCKSLSEYNGEEFSVFLQTHDDDTLLEIEAYSEKKGRVTYSYKNRTAHLQNVTKDRRSNTFKRVFNKRASKFFDGGKVYFVRCDIPYVCAVICNEAEIPKYVVYIDDFTNVVSDDIQGEGKNLTALFRTLLDDGTDAADKQYVFDFDFYISVLKADKNELTDVHYIPDGFEAGHINGLYRNGRCKDLYSGWASSPAPDGASRKRYYRRGELLNGRWKIGDTSYTFDSKGYLISSAS